MLFCATIFSTDPFHYLNNLEEKYGQETQANALLAGWRLCNIVRRPVRLFLYVELRQNVVGLGVGMAFLADISRFMRFGLLHIQSYP